MSESCPGKGAGFSRLWDELVFRGVLMVTRVMFAKIAVSWASSVAVEMSSHHTGAGQSSVCVPENL